MKGAVFVGVRETNVGSLLCFDVGIVQCLINFFFLFLCITSFRDCTVQNTNPESLRDETAKKYGKILFKQKEKKKRKENPNSTMKQDYSVIKRQK